MIILKLSGKREVNLILSEFGLGVDKEELLQIYEYATREKFSPLIVDMEADPTERFRKGLLDVIDIHRLPSAGNAGSTDYVGQGLEIEVKV